MLELLTVGDGSPTTGYSRGAFSRIKAKPELRGHSYHELRDEIPTLNVFNTKKQLTTDPLDSQLTDQPPCS
ncbi:hypothetical protein C5167_042427 [Papaver somniferum]|uniref:Uncharacterized protein n=1 Tax=Papaver somniferum TaxID=3469 RepID=A0A4Y7L5E6_PAPSO|nr:hypothetical protein C5167_042427 [Papaver somniferum]